MTAAEYTIKNSSATINYAAKNDENKMLSRPLSVSITEIYRHLIGIIIIYMYAFCYNIESKGVVVEDLHQDPTGIVQENEKCVSETLY